ncbi:hypothetical protein evm_015256 [Chilo suppressalis]|nr:hypothetical protein evm_015256 [Chilo suppressalis]
MLILTAVIAISSGALLPSNTYIPQNQGPARPSNTYLPQNQGGSSGQGGYQQGQFGQGGSGFGGSGSNGNRRPQQEAEKNAAILKQDQDINDNGFHYSYETSNGIRAEEGGNAAQTQGGFSYKGDDGQTYTIVFTAGEGGFRPQGDHIPVPPPTPEAILQALEQNAKDEASGIFDDACQNCQGNCLNGVPQVDSEGEEEQEDPLTVSLQGSDGEDDTEKENVNEDEDQVPSHPKRARN